MRPDISVVFFFWCAFFLFIKCEDIISPPEFFFFFFFLSFNLMPKRPRWGRSQVSAHPLHCADLGQRVGANLSAEGELVSRLSSVAPRLRRGCLCEVETPPPLRPPFLLLCFSVILQSCMWLDFGLTKTWNYTPIVFRLSPRSLR